MSSCCADVLLYKLSTYSYVVRLFICSVNDLLISVILLVNVPAKFESLPSAYAISPNVSSASGAALMIFVIFSSIESETPLILVSTYCDVA